MKSSKVFRNILVVDDEQIIRERMLQILSEDFNVFDAKNRIEAINLINNEPIDIALLDINLKEAETSVSGIDLLKEIKSINNHIICIMVSGETDRQSIQDAFKFDASDFINKPVETHSLLFRIRKALTEREYKTAKAALEYRTKQDINKNTIIGNSKEIQLLKSEIKKCGRLRLHIHGETGTGKTPAAWYSNGLLQEEYHGSNARPFQHINCSHLKDDRFIDELFGHVKGAYTSAHSDKKGVVELAEGGDLFLDEIGELSLECQAKLLTFLDDYTFSPLGSTIRKCAEVRIISATNKNIREMVEKGSFREDLYSRIAQKVVIIPPLRERSEDIKDIAKYYFEVKCEHPKPVDEEVIKELTLNDFRTGNVRGLITTCELILEAARNDDIIKKEHLPQELSSFRKDVNSLNTSQKYNTDELTTLGYSSFIQSIERNILKNYIADHPNIKITKMAEDLKMCRIRLSRKLDKFDLKHALK